MDGSLEPANPLGPKVSIFVVSPILPESVDAKALLSKCSFDNGLELLAARQAVGTFWRDFPVARLRLTEKNFGLDYFRLDSFRLVSKRLRTAMDIRPDCVQYFDVDSTGSSENVIAADYKIMNVPISEHLSDPAKSVFNTYSIGAGQPQMPSTPSSVHFLEDRSPSSEIFHDHFFLGHVFCSHDFAIKTLKAKCSGIRFYDPKHLGLGDRRYYLTAEGALQQEID